MPTDLDLRQHISALIATERELRDQLARGEISAEEEHDRLKRAEVELDQLWDLLRQRQALREYGGNADEARTRGEDQVERYLG